MLSMVNSMYPALLFTTPVHTAYITSRGEVRSKLDPTAPGWSPTARHRLSTSPVFVCDKPETWLQPQSSQYSGLLAKRPFPGRFDPYRAAIDDALERFGDNAQLKTTVHHNGVQGDVLTNLQEPLDELLAEAALPAVVSGQLRRDACTMSEVVASLCPSATQLDVKVEIFGENSCSRWHQDYYAGRAIITYTGGVGTEYLDDSNVDFHELEHCGNNDCIIRDKRQVRRVMPGDMLFMKGRRFPGAGAGALVHKSPEKRYHPDGRVVHRLLLKIDVPAPGARQPVAGIQWERGGPP